MIDFSQFKIVVTIVNMFRGFFDRFYPTSPASLLTVERLRSEVTGEPMPDLSIEFRFTGNERFWKFKELYVPDCKIALVTMDNSETKVGGLGCLDYQVPTEEDWYDEVMPVFLVLKPHQEETLQVWVKPKKALSKVSASFNFRNSKAKLVTYCDYNLKP